jgi:hypothetical protein
MKEELEKIVLSEHLSQELKAAGFPQDTIFGWISGCIMKFPETTLIECSAPTAEEILEKLPSFIFVDKNPIFLYIWKDNAGLYRIAYCSSSELVGGPAKYQIAKEKPLVAAAAHIWLYLKNCNLL